MKFFLPQTTRPQYEATYKGIVDSLKEQLRWSVIDRRIYSLRYIHDKKEYLAEVGKREPLEHRYEIIAILESNAYIIFTRTTAGQPGTTILVEKGEVQEVIEFDLAKSRQT